jgi:heavy metal sensor kinase
MFDSIRTKLTLWYAGVLALLIIAFAVITYVSFERIFRQETDENLLEMSKNFAFAVNAEQNNEDDKPSPNESITEIIKEFKFKDSYIFVLSNDGKLVEKTFDADFPSNFPLDSYTTFEFNNGNFRVFSTSLNVGNTNFKLLSYHDLAEHFEITNRLFNLFLLITPLVILLAILFGYLLAKRSLKPISEMSRQAKTISANNLNSRLLVKNDRDEIGSLATVINDLLERLENSFEQQRRFMADASHELRTPLAIVRGESEVALSKENRPNEELRESLAIVNDESKRLTKIVEDLFTLSRADAGQFQANFKQVYLDEIVADCVRSIRTLAEKRKINIDFSSTETQINGDEKLLHRLFLNLLDNAVKYNHDGGKISIIVENKQVTVINTGIKIDEIEQTKIFERFYRIDKSRSRSLETNTSGAGLGLSISKWIAELHQAKLELTASDEIQTTFSVKFKN